ncbi:B3 domain-containing protein [Hordeum vulgare]|nr:B3 domain-containing protein [Hordeum vulgare]
MYLDRRWKQFVRAYDLRHGYFLVFRYDDNAMFTVKVFDTTMCCRRYQDDDDANEHPLTEYEKETNDVQEGRTNEVQQGSGVINDDPEYNPKEDEVVVHKTVKALKESRTKRPGVKKTTSKKRKSSEASAAMPPGRVMAPPLGPTKRILEPDEPAPDRFTRQKATMVATTDHQESPLGMDFESSVEMRDDFPPTDEETTLCMDESDTVCVRLTRGAPFIDTNVVVNEEEHQLVLQPGKFTFAMLSFTSAFCKWK